MKNNDKDALGIDVIEYQDVSEDVKINGKIF